MRWRPLLSGAGAILLGGCSGSQSALDPQGPIASGLSLLGWIMFIGGGLIFVAVMGLLLFALIAPPDRKRPLRLALIVGGGVILPVVSLTALLVYTFYAGVRMIEPPPEGALRIEVIGLQWWWEVRYPDFDPPLVTANEIRIPTGRPVSLELATADVIHSFWVPNLAGKIDMIPGRLNRMNLEAQQAGVYRGQCAEFCGLQHSLMAFKLVAETPEDFESWVERQQQPAREPASPFLARGRDAFLQAGCGACHRIRGIGAEGGLGPDLTHVGSRLSLAAGTLDNSLGALAGWIADAQHLKPGNRMPTFDQFDGPTLRAIAAYLESLK